jgi:hypothetical protein
MRYIRSSKINASLAREEEERIKMGERKINSKISKGQSFIEYTLLIIIVAAALTAMTTYIVRAMNAYLVSNSGA